MPTNDPVDPSVRLSISQWPHDAPRGAVTAFCEEHHISRKTFYKIRNIARTDGQAAALAPKSRRPHTTATKADDDTIANALAARHDLQQQGWDHGPISVHDELTRLGLPAPSPATLARIFRNSGAAAPQPRKRPRSSYRRFVAPAPNHLWQIDATDYVLTAGRTCTIFQLIDDHSRLALASLVATGETTAAAMRIVTTAVQRHGAPQRFLSDNGSALNPTRRGREGRLVKYLRSLGVEPITGLPGRPTTQGKNERFHQTLFTWLDKQPLAESIEELQDQVDRFDEFYNTRRRHQGLPGRMTPMQAWQATPKTESPRPAAVSVPIDEPEPVAPQPVTIGVSHTDFLGSAGSGHVSRKVYANNEVAVRGIHFRMPVGHVGKKITVVWDEDNVSFVDADGVVLIEHQWPEPGVRYVGNRQPRGRSPGEGATDKRQRRARKR